MPWMHASIIIKGIAFGIKVYARCIYLVYVGFWYMVVIYLAYVIHTTLYRFQMVTASKGQTRPPQRSGIAPIR
jgi:hypothetical protein